MKKVIIVGILASVLFSASGCASNETLEIDNTDTELETTQVVSKGFSYEIPHGWESSFLDETCQEFYPHGESSSLSSIITIKRYAIVENTSVENQFEYLSDHLTSATNVPGEAFSDIRNADVGENSVISDIGYNSDGKRILGKALVFFIDEKTIVEVIYCGSEEHFSSIENELDVFFASFQTE